MKKKVLVLGSVVAMIVSTALLTTPVNAQVAKNCTTCAAIFSNGEVAIASCIPQGVHPCICPLAGRILANHCDAVGATFPK